MSSAPRLLTDPPPAMAPDAPAWLTQLRQTAWDCFTGQGLPGPRVEQWKYTRLGDLPQRRFRLASAAGERSSTPSAPAPTGPPLAAHQILFHNGHWHGPDATLEALPAGVTLLSLRQALQQRHPLLAQLGQTAQLTGHPFAALNTRWFDDGLLLHLAPGVRLERPILCRFELDAADIATYPRLLVLLEADSAAQLLEEHHTTSSGLSDLVAEIRLGPGARLFHGRVQWAEGEAGNGTVQIDGLHVTQAAGSRYHHYGLQLGGGLHRVDLQLSLGHDGEAAEAAEARLDGLYLLDGHSHVDNHLRIDHRRPGARSAQFYKGILTDHAHAVFNGLAVVHPNAQRSDARQINRNLLLSPGAEVDTKPELQIEADDVQCSHGATVGALDEQALLYLRSRGIPVQQAQALLTWAFARDTLQHLEQPALRDWFQARLVQTLNARLGGELAMLDREGGRQMTGGRCRESGC